MARRPQAAPVYGLTVGHAIEGAAIVSECPAAGQRAHFMVWGGMQTRPMSVCARGGRGSRVWLWNTLWKGGYNGATYCLLGTPPMKIHISLPAEVLAILRQLAHSQRGTVSEVVRQLVVQESTRKPWATLADHPPESPGESRVKAWLRMAGVYPDRATIEALLAFSIDPVTGLPLMRLENPNSRAASIVRRIQSVASIPRTSAEQPCPRCGGREAECPAPDWDASNWRLCPRRVDRGVVDPTPPAALLAQDCHQETGSWPPGWANGKPPKRPYEPSP